MKIKLLLLLFGLVLSFGCNNLKEKNLLGDLPYIAEKYITKINQLQNESTRVTDINEGRKISLELINLKQEADNELNSYFNSNLDKIPIPIESNPEDEFYEIRSVNLTGVEFNKLRIEAEFVPRSEIKNTLFCYMKFVDITGNEISGWIILIYSPQSFGGGSYKFTGTYSGIQNLKSASGIIRKSSEEYQNNSAFSN